MLKQSDIALVILVAGLSLLVSFFVVGAIIKTPTDRSTEVEKVVVISPDFPVPDARIFNEKALNPTELIQIGPGGSEQPFELD